MKATRRCRTNKKRANKEVKTETMTEPPGRANKERVNKEGKTEQCYQT